MHYTILHLEYRPIIFISFCGGVCFGEFFGILIGIFDRDWTGIISGACLGVALGLALSILCMFSIYIFNVFAPIMGGWKITTEDTSPPIESLSSRKIP